MGWELGGVESGDFYILKQMGGVGRGAETMEVTGRELL